MKSRKTLFTAILVSVLLAFSGIAAHSAPFVICNDYPSTAPMPDYFSVTLDTGAAAQSTPLTVQNLDCSASGQPWDCCTGSKAGTCSGVVFHYDIAGVAIGTHSMTVAACSNTTPTQAGGCTGTVPFSFSISVPATAPANLRLNSK